MTHSFFSIKKISLKRTNSQILTITHYLCKVFKTNIFIMIQDIYPHRLDNNFLTHTEIKETDHVIHFKENSILLKTNGNDLEIPRKKDFQGIKNSTKKTFLFSMNDVDCFLIWDELEANDHDLVFNEINFFRLAEQREIAWTSLVAFHLRNWYEQNKFCGKCGTKTEHKKDERAIICPNCKNTIYPQISPAIIVAIVCKDKLLLARNSKFPGSWYSLVAGYVDVGETLTETVIREVKEEVGLDIKNIRYYKSQPWPLSGSMMVGFIAEANDNQSIQIDNKEIAEAAWFSRSELPEHPSNISIAGEMIEMFKQGKL